MVPCVRSRAGWVRAGLVGAVASGRCGRPGTAGPPAARRLGRRTRRCGCGSRRGRRSRRATGRGGVPRLPQRRLGGGVTYRQVGMAVRGQAGSSGVARAGLLDVDEPDLRGGVEAVARAGVRAGPPGLRFTGRPGRGRGRRGACRPGRCARCSITGTRSPGVGGPGCGGAASRAYASPGPGRAVICAGRRGGLRRPAAPRWERPGAPGSARRCPRTAWAGLWAQSFAAAPDMRTRRLPAYGLRARTRLRRRGVAGRRGGPGWGRRAPAPTVGARGGRLWGGATSGRFPGRRP